MKESSRCGPLGQTTSLGEREPIPVRCATTRVVGRSGRGLDDLGPTLGEARAALRCQSWTDKMARGFVRQGGRSRDHTANRPNPS